MNTPLTGYPRAGGRKGIRNHVVVAYLVECAHHVAREIVQPHREAGAQVIGFPGCYPNDYAQQMMELALDCRDIGKDVGMVEFKVI